MTDKAVNDLNAINHNPTSEQFWKSRGLPVPPAEQRVERARQLAEEQAKRASQKR